MVDRRLHDCGTGLAFDGPRSACGIDIGNFHHGEMTGRQFRLGCGADWRHAVAAARFYRLTLRCASGYPQQNRGYAQGRPQGSRIVVRTMATAVTVGKMGPGPSVR